MLTLLIIIYLIQNVLSAEIFFMNKTWPDKSESFGHRYLAIEKWIIWIAYAAIPLLTIVISLVAVGLSETKELQAFFLYIALITLLTTVYFMIILRKGLFTVLEYAVKDVEAIGVIHRRKKHHGITDKKVSEMTE